MRVLVVAAHPDDEVLGCGGAMARHIQSGDEVTVLILGRGLAARGDATPRALAEIEEQSRKALRTLGVEDVHFRNFPDNRFDSVDLLDIVKAVEEMKVACDPHRVYTHAAEDLNIDHRCTFDAVLTAFRPQPGETCRAILTFEVLSATHWRADVFTPSVFVDIGDHLERKQAALLCYEGEMRPWPHARSTGAAEALARFRGSLVGVEAAEAFLPVRIVE